jgi:hypothetical protein
MQRRQISQQRKTLYRVGQIMAILGLLSFLSVFVSAALNFGDFTDFDSQVRSMGLRAVGGIVLIIGGGVIANIAAAGPAGSGLNLDPEKAKEDLEPWARMRGGLAKASLDEMGIDVPKIAGALADAPANDRQTVEERLRGLHALYKDGILTEEEYLREKKELLEKS